MAINVMFSLSCSHWSKDKPYRMLPIVFEHSCCLMVLIYTGCVSLSRLNTWMVSFSNGKHWKKETRAKRKWLYKSYKSSVPKKGYLLYNYILPNNCIRNWLIQPSEETYFAWLIWRDNYTIWKGIANSLSHMLLFNRASNVTLITW